MHLGVGQHAHDDERSPQRSGLGSRRVGYQLRVCAREEFVDFLVAEGTVLG